MDAEQIARALGGGKERKNGAGWVSLCPLHADNKPSLSLKDGKERDVIVHCFTGCDPLAIKDELRSRGLLPEWQPTLLNHQPLPQQKYRAAEIVEQQSDPEEEKPSFPWKKARRDEQDLANIRQYFSSRGINHNKVPVCFKWGSYIDKTGQRINQIVAAVSKPSDTAVYACSRTLINTATWERTDKLMLGKCLGRGVWLDRKGPMFILIASEGIETVLSATQATGHNGVAGLTANGLEALEFPDQANHLFVLVDSDPNLTGQRAAVNLARRFEQSDPTRSAMLVTPDDTCFTETPNKLDFNDLLKADPTGESIRQRFEEAIHIQKFEWEPKEMEKLPTHRGPEPPANSPKKVKIDPKASLEKFSVKKEYTDLIGKEEFLVENLVISQHVIVIVAMSGGGKTTYFYWYVAPLLAGKGYTVVYLDNDSPTSDHPAMREFAERHGFQFLNPDANVGTSIEELKQTLFEIANADSDLSKWVFVFDTLKKFNDMMSKSEIKEFFKLARKLTARGATVVLLAHANKYPSPEGFLIPEGTGDVRSDTDDLILFERTTNANGGIDITTVCDPDRNAKVRGIFKPFSFHISPDREITFYKDALAIPDPTQTAAPKATDDEILTAATEFLKEMAEPVAQQAILTHVCDLTGAGQKRVRALITRHSEREDSPVKKGCRFWFAVGTNNRFSYRLPESERHLEQTDMFDVNQFGSHDLGFGNGV